MAMTDSMRYEETDLSWDARGQKWVRCEWNGCGGSPCNEYQRHWYCEEHFEKAQGGL